MWITVTIALLISVAALAYVIWPFITNKVPPYHVENDELIELITRKDGLMAAIKDLEFDFQVGKISEEDYQRFDARLRRQAIAYMQQIEKISPEIAGMDASIEAEINRYRRTVNGHATPTPATPTPTVTPPALDTVGTSGEKARYCTTCGEVLSPSHKFCANCGESVAPVAVSQN
jgi:hypothetical protein